MLCRHQNQGRHRSQHPVALGRGQLAQRGPAPRGPASQAADPKGPLPRPWVRSGVGLVHSACNGRLSTAAGSARGAVRGWPGRAEGTRLCPHDPFWSRGVLSQSLTCCCLSPAPLPQHPAPAGRGVQPHHVAGVQRRLREGDADFYHPEG